MKVLESTFMPKKSAIEKFFRWKESSKKVLPKYEIKEPSYLEVLVLEAIIGFDEVSG